MRYLDGRSVRSVCLLLGMVAGFLVGMSVCTMALESQVEVVRVTCLSYPGGHSRPMPGCMRHASVGAVHLLVGDHVVGPRHVQDHLPAR